MASVSVELMVKNNLIILLPIWRMYWRWRGQVTCFSTACPCKIVMAINPKARRGIDVQRSFGRHAGKSNKGAFWVSMYIQKI